MIQVMMMNNVAMILPLLLRLQVFVKTVFILSIPHILKF